MRIHVACDHAAFDLKEALVNHLQEKGLEVIDHGSKEYDAKDDYPDTCIPCAEAVLKDEGSLGVVLGGSGNGEQMAANCVKGIRAALAWSLETAKLARMHNNAQIVAVGARMHEIPEALAIIDAFIAEPFTGEQRHQRRIDLMAKYEQDN
ncbi:ribose-5-phosphate isomerase [Varibaculum cambriense]|uniref:ribose-5-phosphate isomerase n=1 Tax=Varibaculum cambriense TaxID=184870 RepID=UPI002803FD6F|nr:ribose-5-phosphate isomerase [Varibaculum cambriense]MDU5316672.1 ribose-5-phosphate isomerase [Varibaculum cambriense]MDU5615463.1 ribose-5-phosphate isomerase [Varibaculum cambriense]MDU7407994.1 ribose-5-phosphate isomerase [Varibaculum cambriense]